MTQRNYELLIYAGGELIPFEDDLSSSSLSAAIDQDITGIASGSWLEAVISSDSGTIPGLVAVAIPPNYEEDALNLDSRMFLIYFENRRGQLYFHIWRQTKNGNHHIQIINPDITHLNEDLGKIYRNMNISPERFREDYSIIEKVYQRATCNA